MSVLGAISSEGLTYGYKNIKAGLNYKQLSARTIIKLDAIAAHIAHAKIEVLKKKEKFSLIFLKVG